MLSWGSKRMAASLITITSTFPSYLGRRTSPIVHKLAGTRPSSSPLLARPDSSDTEAHYLVAALRSRGICSSSVESEVVMSGKVVPQKSLENFQTPEEISYLTQQEAAEIDDMLMGPFGFSVDQLMELAGLSVATAVAEAGSTVRQWRATATTSGDFRWRPAAAGDRQVFKPSTHSRVLAICGPGNNGGDGLVAARHLYHFGYKPFICYPKRTTKALYSGLVTQLESLSIPFLTAEELPFDLSNDFDIIVDAMFGFSFHGAPRAPFDVLIQKLVDLQNVDYGPKMPAIVSIDIPSGWHVEDGDVGERGIKPDMLVSLTAPKLCAKKFSGPHHFLGGRFVPPTIIQKYMLKLPQYPGTSMCVRIGKPKAVDVSSLRENYLSPVFLEDQVHDDPMIQFNKWFEDAVAAGLREPNAMALSTADKNGKPSSRMVLLKGFDENGFVWYTNYESRKAVEISENSNACLLFFWNDLNRQVRIEGTVQKVPEDESDKYFHSRPRGSQIGAIVSKQSSVIPGRHLLRQAYEELEAKFSDVSDIVPRPKHWGGYCLKPTMFEFWQGQQSRLHDRLRYSIREVGGKQVWHIDRLAP
ncbi:pyridoxine/pyridoxamine 5'-phosphate oxidase 1, chloroplastic isoform X3 [Nymphaea colorata]|uniref:pyridoxine/pyridoxamine 5'-phosphate oxidase 1, chloroplastic isoform X3 n=1 Tax=Nymphaea colorata TaxID=210225 RepID=UPI00129EB3E5|nr:pyridoxine/pyridoxamine 5'-phosphate oxidase 1, chloroplastic isoform X3 [Nymphaea colorata]